MAYIPASQIQLVRTDIEEEDAIASYSAREASYYRSGWTQRSVEASLWSLDTYAHHRSGNVPSDRSSSAMTVSVIGRYVHSKCLLVLGKQLRVHPELESADGTQRARAEGPLSGLA